MRDVYRCTPDEFDQIDDTVITMHREFLQIERRLARIAGKRAEQRRKIGAKVED